MKEKPILFSGEMVRAILDGRKTQTRRVIRPQPPMGEFGSLDCGRISEAGIYYPAVVDRYGNLEPGEPVFGVHDDNGEWGAKSPYGRPGDLLVPRTTWAVLPEWDNRKPSEIDPEAVSIWFWFAGSRDKPSGAGKSRPGRFLPKTLWRYMPRLRITAIRVERVQDITPDDAISEGVNSMYPEMQQKGQVAWALAAKNAFEELWDSINAKRGYGWRVNPWVWCVTFELVTPHY